MNSISAENLSISGYVESPCAVLRKTALKFTKGSKPENSLYLLYYDLLLFGFHQNSISSTKNPAVMLE